MVWDAEWEGEIVVKREAKNLIKSSFKVLIRNKSMDKVSVKEICEHCEINRQTFYNHYTDIFDIFKCIFTEELFALIDENKNLCNWCGGFLSTLEYLKGNAKMVLHVYHSSYRLEANALFTKISSRLLEDVVEECLKESDLKLLEKDKQFIINFYRHVFNGIMMDWVNEGMREEPVVLTNKLHAMLLGSIPRAVETFSKESQRPYPFKKESVK